MNYVRCFLTAILVIASISSIGCKSKQDKPGANAGKTGATAVGGKAAAPSVSNEEKDAARTAAARVLAQFSSGDFATIYKDSAAGFKQIGSESQFVEKFQQTRQRVGVLKNPKEISFETRPDSSHVLVYRLENDHYNTDMRLTFSRIKSGKMELSGLNQHDELKK
ncbi:MAG TPA: hypothetical protein VN642_02275 [Dongiaceae bacterium]|nr:hypothetical protein [Dongiaceae bacterium]